MRHFRTAVRRLQTESQRDFEGGMHVFDRAEWDQFHLRHAEMHLGFVYPIRGEVVNG
jgi:hypothetical protein